MADNFRQKAQYREEAKMHKPSIYEYLCKIKKPAASQQIHEQAMPACMTGMKHY